MKILYIILKLFYHKAKSFNPLYVLATVFFSQKILGFNRFVPWPVHHTSRVLNWKNIEIGERSFPGWNSGCYIQGRNGIKIGYNLRMGPNIGLISANHDPDDYDKWIKTDPIIIGNNVWIGMGSVVLPGVQIGDNVIIAANSVVNKSIPSNSIAGGIPCKVLKEKSPYKGKNYSKL
jgi:acetyltransferase-like isoleucine patch superfamily enzyme